jgi:hypothetical protein
MSGVGPRFGLAERPVMAKQSFATRLRQASVPSTEERLSPRKNNIEIQDAIAGAIFRWNRLCNQQVRT